MVVSLGETWKQIVEYVVTRRISEDNCGRWSHTEKLGGRLWKMQWATGLNDVSNERKKKREIRLVSSKFFPSVFFGMIQSCGSSRRREVHVKVNVVVYNTIRFPNLVCFRRVKPNRWSGKKNRK